jgi:hypothetical protein
VNEVLERNDRRVGGGSTFYCAVSDPDSERVYRAEPVDDEILVGLQGSSQIREDDLKLLGIEGADRLLSRLKSKTSDMQLY